VPPELLSTASFIGSEAASDEGNAHEDDSAYTSADEDSSVEDGEVEAGAHVEPSDITDPVPAQTGIMHAGLRCSSRLLRCL